MISLLQGRSAQASHADVADEAVDLFESVMAAIDSGNCLSLPGRPGTSAVRTFVVA